MARDHYSRALVTENQEEQNILIDAGQLRTWEYGSLEATQKALDENHIDYAVSLPVMPNSSFEEALAASKLEPRLLPFTSADFRLPIPEMKAKLKRDIIRGAKGLKLHPILQNVPLTDERTYAAVEVFGEMGLPITSHCGINDYYKPGSKYQPLAPKEYGELHYMLALISGIRITSLFPRMPEEIAAGSTRSWRRLFTSTAGKMCIQTHRLKTQRSCGNWPDCLAKISCCLQPIIPSTGSHSLLQPVKRLLRTILFLRTRCFTEMQRSCFICEERRM